MHGLGYKSVSTVAIHVNGLLAKGYIRKKDHSARSIEIVSMQQGKQAAAVIAKSEDYLQGFDRAVRERLASDSYSPKDHEVLVRAAEILGSTQAATFRAQLVGRHGAILETDEEGTADSTTT